MSGHRLQASTDVKVAGHTARHHQCGDVLQVYRVEIFYPSLESLTQMLGHTVLQGSAHTLPIWGTISSQSTSVLVLALAM